MKKTFTRNRPYLLSALLGAIGGGVIVIIATRAIPTMISSILSGMMKNMMSHIEASGCNPKEMCQQMMAGFAEASKE